MTFSGYLNVKQTGHAVLHVDKFNEDHLIPLPSFTVRGFMGAQLYPEITATHHIISTTGYVTEVRFVGRGIFSGVRNSFTAKLYHSDDKRQSPLYTMQGQWNDKFEICHVPSGELETHDVNLGSAASTIDKAIKDQDPWESRRAWKDVYVALRDGNMQATMQQKSKLEQAQRDMRKQEKLEGSQWEAMFFTQMTAKYTLFERLASLTHWPLHPERTKGVWKFDHDKAKLAKRPYRGELTPFG